MERVAVVGLGNIVFKARHVDRTFPRLAYEAVKACLEDAGAAPGDVESAVYGICNDFFEHCAMPDHHVHYLPGLARKPAVRVTNGGATGRVRREGRVRGDRRRHAGGGGVSAARRAHRQAARLLLCS